MSAKPVKMREERREGETMPRKVAYPLHKKKSYYHKKSVSYEAEAYGQKYRKFWTWHTTPVST